MKSYFYIIDHFKNKYSYIDRSFYGKPLSINIDFDLILEELTSKNKNKNNLLYKLFNLFENKEKLYKSKKNLSTYYDFLQSEKLELKKNLEFLKILKSDPTAAIINDKKEKMSNEKSIETVNNAVEFYKNSVSDKSLFNITLKMFLEPYNIESYIDNLIIMLNLFDKKINVNFVVPDKFIYDDENKHIFIKFKQLNNSNLDLYFYTRSSWILNNFCDSIEAIYKESGIEFDTKKFQKVDINDLQSVILQNWKEDWTNYTKLLISKHKNHIIKNENIDFEIFYRLNKKTIHEIAVSKVVILTEGMNDKLLFESLDFPFQYKIIDSKGKYYQPIYIWLFHYFKIPYVVYFDTDNDEADKTINTLIKKLAFDSYITQRKILNDSNSKTIEDYIQPIHKSNIDDVYVKIMNLDKTHLKRLINHSIRDNVHSSKNYLSTPFTDIKYSYSNWDEIKKRNLKIWITYDVVKNNFIFDKQIDTSYSHWLSKKPNQYVFNLPLLCATDSEISKSIVFAKLLGLTYIEVGKITKEFWENPKTTDELKEDISRKDKILFHKTNIRESELNENYFTDDFIKKINFIMKEENKFLIERYKKLENN